MNEGESAYRDAGVDIDAKYRAVAGAGDAIRATFTAGVVGDIGLFGGLFDLDAVGAAGQLLVASTDGVGTKVKIARLAGRFGSVGADLVNHCVDDILVQGARPLFFLDYVAVDRLAPETVQAVIEGIAGACRDNGCALLGGETAEMPGVYRDGEMDIAGTIVGCVERSRLLDGTKIAAGDRLLALASSGLHTNGYSLARKILFDDAGLGVGDRPRPLGGESIGDALLAVHRSYLAPARPLLERGLLHGMAHITGGGLYDNIPRVVPADLGVVIDRDAVPRAPIFDLLVELGGIATAEAYRVFNMGFGLVLFVDPRDVDEACACVADAGFEAHPAGEVVAGASGVELR